MLRKPVHGGSNCGGWGGPHQKNGVDAVQTPIKRFGKTEISAHHLNRWWQISRLWIAGHRSDLRARSLQFTDNLAADIAGCSDNENAIHHKNRFRSQLQKKIVSRGTNACKRRHIVVQEPCRHLFATTLSGIARTESAS